MKKLVLFCFLFSSILIHSQSSLILSEPSLSPNGALENVFDRFGNKSKLSDVLVGKTVKNASGVILRSTSPTPVTAGYFNLYFESGSGMENWATNATEAERKNILVQVFSDISNFITSPLTTSGKKVNIWVRNIANIPNTPSTVAGLASSFYTAPYNTTTGFGGIIDAEIWKTIHLGKDSYTNVVSPLAIDPVNSNASATGYFYHGMVAFRFTGFSWNTNLSATSITNLDLYSIALHEVTHALGFASLIGNDGKSKLGAGYNYYTRYDLKLKNSANTNALITNTGACNSMYNYSFNSALNTSILVSTVCANAIKYVGSSTVSVYTPSVFQDGGSLSHYGPCTAGNFVMAPSIGNGIIRRFFTQQEKNALVEMGYTVSGSYGNATMGTVNYTGSNVGISVSGMNDGIGTNGLYSYTFVEGSIIPLTINSSTNSAIRILANDVNGAGIPTGFECLQDITDPTSTTTVTPSSGTTTTNVTFTSTVTGLHLLRYVPINSSGQKGNITYIYVNVEPSGSCGTATASNLVKNGNFEQYSIISSNYWYNNISDSCGWSKGNNTDPNYYNSAFINSYSNYLKTPCNFWGYETDLIASNKGYAGFITINNGVNESIKTKLTSTLISNTNYQLSFDISLSEGNSAKQAKIQAYLSDSYITYPSYTGINIANPSMLFTTNSFLNKTDGWEKVVFNFSTGNNTNLNTLYLGFLSNVSKTSNTPSIQGLYGCNYANRNDPNDPNNGAHYYIDNVSLVPSNGSFTITPNSICNALSLPDLRVYLSGLPTNGVFSGTGVSYNSTTGLYSFSTTNATMGINTISYTYTNPSGFLVTLYCNVNVLVSKPIINGSLSACTYTTTLATKTYTTTIPSGITALWSVTGGTIQGSNNGSSVTVVWNSLPGQLSLTFTNSSCIKTTTFSIASDCCDCLNTGIWKSVPSKVQTQPSSYCVLDNTCANLGYNLSYVWSFTNGTTISTSTNCISELQNGVVLVNNGVKIKIFDQNNQVACSRTFGNVIINRQFNQETIEKTSDINVSPNPSDGIYDIRIDNFEGIIAIEVFDLNGRLVYSQKNIEYADTFFIDLSILEKGTYMLKISGDTINTIQKLIKN